jgi:hypothetical protein
LGDYSHTQNAWGTIVIPKPNQTPDSVLVEGIGLTQGTAFYIATFCPAALPSFNSTPVQSDGSCNPLTETFYFARNADRVAGAGGLEVQSR